MEPLKIKIETSEVPDNFIDIKNNEVNKSAKKRFACSFCKYSCDTKQYITLHEANHSKKKYFTRHTNEPNKDGTQKEMFSEDKLQCPWCDYTTLRKNHMAIHMATHTGERPHKCTQCDYRAITKNQLAQHEVTHKKEKTYKCAWCSYSSFYKQHFKIHEASHTGSRPHQCSYCEYRAITKTQLSQHMITHNKELPYKCSLCDYRSAYKHVAARHEANRRCEKSNFQCKRCTFKTSTREKLDQHGQKLHGDDKLKFQLIAPKITPSEPKPNLLNINGQIFRVDLVYIKDT